MLGCLWLRYGLMLSARERKAADVAVTPAVTQQGEGKKASWELPFPFLTPSNAMCCLALCSGAPGSAVLRNEE